MKYNINIGISLILTVCLIYVWTTCTLHIERFEYHVNRNIENAYLIDLVNRSDFSYEYLSKKWGRKLKPIQGENIYLLDSEHVVSSKYFLKNNYIQDNTDFYGYTFTFNDEGKLDKFGLYKP